MTIQHVLEMNNKTIQYNTFNEILSTTPYIWYQKAGTQNKDASLEKYFIIYNRKVGRKIKSDVLTVYVALS